MRERKPLKLNTELKFKNHAGGNMSFVVGDVVGFGGSCIVYSGYYINNAGAKNTVRLKECYPFRLHINRMETGELVAADYEKDRFDVYKDRVRKSFEVTNELHEAVGLTNYTSNVFDIYEANNTVYIISSYVEGSTLSNVVFQSLEEAIRVVMSVAKSIDRLHKQGYLYLDVKPENILMYEETSELIQLFDFDSVIPVRAQDNITEYRISYSKNFAPIEQKSGNLSQIGKYTDVYSVGALLFYLLFGKAPGAADCGPEAEYDYAKLKWEKRYRPKVYKELTVFFHHTLQAYYKDRYQDMSGFIAQLKKIEKYAGMPAPFLCSDYVTNSGLVVGREKECRKLLNWYNGNERLIFVTGMGGIGKSTIVRKFASDNQDKFDYMVYLQFKASICETITDDTQFCISGYEKEAEESSKEYFARKMKAARELTADTNTLLIIDNFDGAITEEFAELLKANWKIIAVTRSDMSDSGYAIQKIEELSEKKDMYLLFENNMGRKLASGEFHKVECIAEMVKGHTLVLVLIAKQIAKSYLDVDEALEIVKINGFSRIAPEKVDYMQDGVMHYEKVSTIIRAIYDVSVLSDEQKKCLKFLSLFDVPGIEVKEAGRVLRLESLDAVNILEDLGWVEIMGHNIQMHPLIRETLRQVPWTDEYREIALEEMKILIKKIKMNGNQEESVSEKPDYQQLRQALSMAQSILWYCGDDPIICEREIYKDLLFVTLIHLPKDQEDYIIYNADRLFDDINYQNPYCVIELYDYVVYLFCQKENYAKAREYLNKAKRFAIEWKVHYVWGRYYDMLSDYYDALLDGAYSGKDEDEDETALVDEMFCAADLSIQHMSQSKHKTAKILSVKYILGKANLLIRSKPDHAREIKRLILSTKGMIEKYTPKYAEVRAIYDMAWAWYYTLCEENEEAVRHHLKEAFSVDERRNMSDLDKIDDFYIPAANMMIELGNVDKTIEWLEEAYDLCRLHQEEIPYIRKKMDLLQYEIETYECEGRIDDCKGILDRVDLVNQEAREFAT